MRRPCDKAGVGVKSQFLPCQVVLASSQEKPLGGHVEVRCIEITGMGSFLWRPKL